MKNREKFRDEIVTMVLDGETCDFMKNVVIPEYIDGRERSENFCSTNSCEDCSKLFAFWLDEDYEATPTDWVNVPVDTLVRVWDTRAYECVLRYFKGIDDSNPTRKYVAWAKGATSVTAYGQVTHWKHCELAEDEE